MEGVFFLEKKNQGRSACSVENNLLCNDLLHMPISYLCVCMFV